MPRPEFEVDEARVFSDVGGIHNFIIVVGERPVIWNRSSGTAVHMTYRQEAKARITLARVQAVLPDATLRGIER